MSFAALAAIWTRLGSRLWKPFIIPVLVLGSFLDSYNPFGGQEGFENDPEPKGSVQF